jgi:acetyltransferase-like isoleucine patch superfamily enzyme
LVGFIKRKILGKAKPVMKKILHLLRIIKDSKISVIDYIYYNYFSKNIIRLGGGKIIPYKGTVLDLHPAARIYLKDRNLEICGNKLNKSKSEAHIRMNKNSVWNCNNGGYLFYDTVLEIKENAVLDSGYFSANGGSVIIAHKHITLGEDVMIGRNVIVYDSDFHTINNKHGVPSNPPKPVVIEDHVWLTTNIMVQKGVTIGKDSLIAAYTVVNKDVPPHSIIGGKSVGLVIGDEVSWSRNICPMD